jgi:hypothetical protein
MLLVGWLAVANVANHPTEGYLQGPSGLGALLSCGGSVGRGLSWPASLRGHAAPHCIMRGRQSPAVAAPGGLPVEQLARWDTHRRPPTSPARKQELQHVLAGYLADPQRDESAGGLRPASASVASTERAPELLGAPATGRGRGCRLQTYRDKMWHIRFDEYVATLRSPCTIFTREDRNWMHYNRHQHAIGGLAAERVARFQAEGMDLSLDEVPLLATS